MASDINGYLEGLLQIFIMKLNLKFGLLFIYFFFLSANAPVSPQAILGHRILSL